MLTSFSDYLALAQEAFAAGAPAWDGALEPTKLAAMLVFSFQEDIEQTLLSSDYATIELPRVGNLKRAEGNRIFFAPDLHFIGYEIAKKQFLLDGKFWRVLCRVDMVQEMFCLPPPFMGGHIYGSACLREVGECMITVIQRYTRFLSDIALETLWNGLCLAIHDTVCSGSTFYLERIGTLFPNGHFEPDRLLLARMREQEKAKKASEQCPFIWPGSRRTTNDKAWYRSDG